MRSLSLTLILLNLMSTLGLAAVLAYDGFNVPANYKSNGGYANPTISNSNALVWDVDTVAGDSVGQAPALAGFSTNGWVAQSGTNISVSVYPRVDNAQTLTYTTGLGQQLTTNTGQVSLFRTSGDAAGMKSFERELTVPASFNTTPLYMSGMFQFTNNVVNAKIESGFTSGTESRSFGMRVDGATGKLYATGAAAGEIEVATLTAGMTYFFVWEITNSTNPNPSQAGVTGDSIRIYLNPLDLSNQDNNSPTAVLSSPGANFFVHNNAAWWMKNIGFGANINGGNQFIVDEFRIGTSWWDVVPFMVVPEPNRASLIMAALIMGVFHRRR